MCVHLYVCEEIEEAWEEEIMLVNDEVADRLCVYAYIHACMR